MKKKKPKMPKSGGARMVERERLRKKIKAARKKAAQEKTK